jgi:hypothetical protein
MRKTSSVLVLISCGLWSASLATAGSSICDAVTANLVANCGFETGDFTSWTLGLNTLNPLGNYFGVDAIDANSGNNGAYMSQDLIDGGTTPVSLTQTLATALGSQYLVSFWLEQDTAPNLGYTHSFTATWGGSTILSLTPTPASPGPVGTFTEYSFSEVATAASTTLAFAFENDDNYWSFDDVSVTLEPTPEPSTYLLAGMALSAVLLRRVTARKRCLQ